MAVFRVERNKGYTVMSNHHLRNKELSLKAKGLLFLYREKPSEKHRDGKQVSSLRATTRIEGR